MLGDFILRILVLVLGYVYPAFECFKTIERSRPDAEYLRFWCQYWVIIAAVTALEKFGDIFVSWVPLYGESKLAFIIYLWHPRTMGTNYVYTRMVRPFMAQHETDIEKRLQGMLTKTIDLLLFYIKNFTDKGQSIAFEILQHVVSKPWGSSSTPEKIEPSPPPRQKKGKTTIKRPSRQSQSSELVQEEELDMDQINLKKIEETFRAAGVNLKEISNPTMRKR